MPLSVLLVDDDPTAHVLYGEALVDHDHQLSVTESSTIDEALSALDGGAPVIDCILLDYSLPDGTGFELMSRLAERKGSPPVVLLTGRGCEQIAAESIKRGAHDYISKDQATPESLSRAIHNAVGHARLQAELDQQQHELETLARYDSLTGLYNRHSFMNLLDEAVKRSPRRTGMLVLMFIDLDGFKLINDTFGHSAGDDTLREVGTRIRECVRTIDPCARLGGDEFAVLLEDVPGSDQASEVASKLLDTIHQPLRIRASGARVSASIGISTLQGAEKDTDLLLNEADQAMYSAKRGGKNAVRFHTPEMNARMQLRQELMASLNAAMGRGELTPWYQPICDPKDRVPHHFELLLRWHHPRAGYVSPSVFVPYLEELGLIRQVSQWVLNHACKQRAAWQQSGFMRDGSIAVNLSSRQIIHTDVVDMVQDAADRHLVEPAWIALEVTEQSLITDTDRAMQNLSALRDRGFRIALDDFGTGYSSLSHLRLLPFDTIKIDRSFISDLHQEDNKSIVSSVIGLAHSLRAQVIAEGIENGRQLATLCDLNCDLVQGYYLGAPCPAEHTERDLRGQDKWDKVPA